MGKEFARLERMIMERRGRAAAHVVVAPIDTAQPCNPRSSCSEISFDVHIFMERNTQGRMNPEPGQLEPSLAGTGQFESPSTGTGFETPGQQCPPNQEMGRITVDGCLLVGMSSSLGGNFFSSKSLLSVCLTTRSQPTKKTSSLTEVGKEGSHRFEKRMYWHSCFFLGDVWTWMPGSFLLPLPVCLFCVYFVLFFTTGKIR